MSWSPPFANSLQSGPGEHPLWRYKGFGAVKAEELDARVLYSAGVPGGGELRAVRH